MKSVLIAYFSLTGKTEKMAEGMRACHDYGRIFGEKLGS